MPLVPDRSVYDPVLGATLHTGGRAIGAGACFSGGDLAIDIETPGLSAAFTINCVTAAWVEDGSVVAVLLDPRRDPRHHRLAADMFAAADRLILHNAAFDTPALWHAGLIGPGEVNKMTDTLLLARMAWPDTFVPKSLGALAAAHLGLDDVADGMKLAFKAAGYRTLADGYEGMDIDSPIYRQGAMADTVATLRLEPLLRQAVIDWSLDHPFRFPAPTTVAQVVELIGVQETVNRVMLRRSAVGIAVDGDYLDRYSDQVDSARHEAAALLAAAGLEGGAGKANALVCYLDSIGELPGDWPRTPTGKLKATKDQLAGLHHPLAVAQRSLAEMDKVSGYLEKVAAQAKVTGRCHPQVGVLGASATGRMCIPTTHGILTRRGVLKHDEVVVGDETIDMNGEWVRVTGVHHYSDQDTVIRTGRNLRLEATSEHRWVSRSEFGKLYVGPLTETQRRSIHLAPLGSDFDIRGRTIDAQTEGEKFAALIGVLVTDGRCVETGNGLRGYVYQSQRKYLAEFLRVIPEDAVMYDRVLPTSNTRTTAGNHEIRIKTKWLRPRLEAAGLRPDPHLTDDPNLTGWVLGLTLRECAAFLRAGYLSDGIASTNQGQRMIAQRAAARKAFRVAAYRLGYRTHETVTDSTGWGTDPVVSVWFVKRPPSTRYMEVSHGRSDVWCVTTESGTFTAWDDGPYLTGNSYRAPELQQFPAPARPILVDDGGLTSIDFCFDGSTMVETVYNGVKRIRDITPGEHVWSWKDGRCVVGTVTAAAKTQDWAECTEVLLDNGKSVICTTNHPWLLNNGTYIRADHLTVGMSLAAFRRTTDAYGYECVYSRSAFEYTKTHRAVGEHVHGPLPDGWHTHHVDEDKRNNHPDNLRYVTPQEHSDLTPRTDVQRRASAANALKMVAGRRSYEGAGNPNHGKLKGEYRTCEHCDAEFYVSRANLKRGQGRFCNRACYDSARSGKTNHKVVATRIVARRPVWDITVEGEHNFALEAGVFVHNCQIEPVTMALMAKDTEFLAPFEAGADLYEPIQRAAGIDRPTAKVVLLATMYGQGVASLARRIAHTEESAGQIRRQMLAAMPASGRWMARVQQLASDYGRAVTAAGRVLPVDPQGVYRAVNHTVQGSALDVLHHTICEMERQGMGDELFLTLHDEVVVSTAAAEEVQHIMVTAPPFLARLAGREPVLRTDMADLGRSWDKC